MPVVVISPHFDDAVLSVGGLISARLRSGDAVTVVTVFGGIPEASVEAHEWDASTGFRSAASACVARRAEDIAAHRALGSGYVHLPFLDEPYRTSPVREKLAAALPPLVAGASEIFVPSGVGDHADHVLCRDLALAAIDYSTGPAVWLYADLPYAADLPGWGGPEALTMLDGSPHGLGDPVAHVFDGEAWDVKLDALLCYRSQVSPLTTEHGPYLEYPGRMQHELVWPVLR